MPAEPKLTRSGSQAPAWTLTPKVAAALVRYRIAAFAVGVGLLLLCLAIVLKYAFSMDWAVTVWGPIHGVLYVAYVLLAFDLFYKAHWKLWSLLGVLLAGVIPVVSFIAESRVTRRMLSGRRL